MNDVMQGPTERARVGGAKVQQDYDSNPPRCATCVYFRREPHTLYVDRQVKTRSGKVKMIRTKAKKHPTRNPLVDRCSFGNFQVKPHHVCNEWHSHSGERIEEPTPEGGG